jgi:hypothetical protein
MSKEQNAEKKESLPEKALWLLLPLAALLYPALYNGFPLLYSDSGTYMQAGFENRSPIDRPVMYCLFIRHLSLAETIWLPLIAQTMLLLWLSKLFIEKIFLIKNARKASALLLSIMALITGVSNYASQLMPDLFTGMFFMALILWFFGDFSKKREKILLFTALLFMAGIHYSNLALYAGLAVASVIARFFMFGRVNRGWWLKFVYTGISVFLIVPFVNLLSEGRFYYSGANHVFLAGSLVNMGVMQDHLGRTCAAQPVFLCESRDKLKDMEAAGFLWSEESPLCETYHKEHKTWQECWKERNSELGEIIKDILKNKRSRELFLKASAQAFGKQLTDFEIGPLSAQGLHSAPYYAFRDRFTRDYSAYSSAKQFTKNLSFEGESRIQLWSVCLSFIILAGLLYTGRDQTRNKYFFCIWLLLLLFLIGNAAVCGILSNPLNRYQARVIWLLPYFSGAWLMARVRFFKE